MYRSSSSASRLRHPTTTLMPDTSIPTNTSNLALLIGEQRFPLLIQHHRFHSEIQALAFPESHIDVGHVGTVKKDSRRHKSAVLVEHLKESARVVVAFAQGAPIDIHHGGVEATLEVGWSFAHLRLAFQRSRLYLARQLQNPRSEHLLQLQQTVDRPRLDLARRVRFVDGSRAIDGDS
jgi:hypothetical protein